MDKEMEVEDDEEDEEEKKLPSAAAAAVLLSSNEINLFYIGNRVPRDMKVTPTADYQSQRRVAYLASPLETEDFPPRIFRSLRVNL